MTTEALEHTARIAAAYFSHNQVPADQVPEVLRRIGQAILSLNAPPEPDQKPAHDPRKSVSDDFIICLEDGKKLKTLKRYLRVQYGLTVAINTGRSGSSRPIIQACRARICAAPVCVREKDRARTRAVVAQATQMIARPPEPGVVERDPGRDAASRVTSLRRRAR